MADGASILALLPFRVHGALSLRVLREMRRRGLRVAVAYTDTPPELTLDAAADFAADGSLLDLSRVVGHDRQEVLERELRERRVGLVLQIGATALYPVLPYLKEKLRSLAIVDTLYNEVGHVVNHFLYERCLDGVIVESHHMRRFVERSTAKASPNVLLVESGIELDAFTPAPAPRSGPNLVVGYVGRMSPEKNPVGFVELCERLHAEDPSLAFRMIGAGPSTEDVRRRIEKSRLGGAMDFRGFEPDLAAGLRGLDVLVVPSKLDGRPNVVMEANACGVPVLGAPVGGIPELLEDGRNGYRVQPGETARILGILRAWQADPAALAAVRRACRETAERHFDQRRMMDRYEEVFRGQLAAGAAV